MGTKVSNERRKRSFRPPFIAAVHDPSASYGVRVAIAIVLAALGLAALLTAIGWFLGWAPAGYGTPLHASFVEARQRTADAAAEFWEWLRLGR
jgi:hypothetical protein